MVRILLLSLFTIHFLFSAQAQSADDLFFAVKTGDEKAVKDLLKKGVNVNQADKQGRTAFDYAFDWGVPVRPAILHLLIDAGLKPNGGKSDHALAKPPLVWVAEKGLPELFDKLLSKGADINIKEPLSANTVLHMAVQWDFYSTRESEAQYKDRVKIIETCLAKGLDINTRNAAQFTPLMISVGSASAIFCTYLIEKGADYTVRTKDKRNLLHLLFMRAPDFNTIKAASALMRKSVELRDDGFAFPPFVFALINKHYEFIDALKKNGFTFDVNGMDKNMPEKIVTLDRPDALYFLIKNGFYGAPALEAIEQALTNAQVRRNERLIRMLIDSTGIPFKEAYFVSFLQEQTAQISPFIPDKKSSVTQLFSYLHKKNGNKLPADVWRFFGPTRNLTLMKMAIAEKQRPDSTAAIPSPLQYACMQHASVAGGAKVSVEVVKLLLANGATINEMLVKEISLPATGKSPALVLPEGATPLDIALFCKADAGFIAFLKQKGAVTRTFPGK